MNWISVKDSLPMERQDELLVKANWFINQDGRNSIGVDYFLAKYEDGNFFLRGNIGEWTLAENNVTHWCKVVPPQK